MVTEPSLQPHDLPGLDAVLLSHLHGDHFDRVARQQLSRAQPVLTTEAAARRLSGWGFVARGLSTWTGQTFVKGRESLVVEALPALHARGVMAALLPPVIGFLVDHHVSDELRRRIYISGDTLTGDHVSQIARRHPDIDLAIIHLGGTRVLLHTVTMDGEQGVDLLRRVRPTEVVPVHYDDYGVFRSPLSDFVDRASSAGLRTVVRQVPRGGTLTLREID